jgi:hypothetical protein
MKVNLSKILEALEFINSENAAYVNVKNGEVVLLSDSDISAAEDDCGIEGYPEWQQETIAIAKEIFLEDSKDYIELPDDFEIDEYDMMVSFIDSLSSDNITQALAKSIKGRGAFRRFKDCLYRFEVQKKWFMYRDDEYKQVAIQWCEEHEIDYIEG